MENKQTPHATRKEIDDAVKNVIEDLDGFNFLDRHVIVDKATQHYDAKEKKDFVEELKLIQG